MKTCTDCKETKPLEEFQKRASNKDGRTGKCKVCKRLYDNAHYKAHPSRRQDIRDSNIRREEKVKKWIYNYLQDHPCLDCGEDDIVVLEFDHREDKCYNIGNMLSVFGVARVIKEINKCDVRCANCHRKKTAREQGWWRTKIMLP